MGLERITAVIQGKSSNYDSDLFSPIIRLMEEISGRAYGVDGKADVSMRVVADHARGVAFLICEGIVPSNEGRGYVLRRIIRRAARHGRLLGIDGPFLHRASQVVVEQMKDAYPELGHRRAAIAQIVLREEERFAETLDKGLRILWEEKERLRARGLRIVPGEVVFRLYDTYGFPVDLTEDVAAEDGFGIDAEGFERAMEEQRRRARAAWAGSGEEEVPEPYRRIASRGISTEFVGYEGLSAVSEVAALLVGGEEAARAEAGAPVEVIVPRTPFYGESGGQVGDRGVIHAPGLRVEVRDTLRPLPGLTVHVGEIVEGSLCVGQEVELRVDEGARWDTARNHSATHILQSVLREVLGEVVHQSGSKVTPDGFRFDYTYSSPVSAEEIARIERRVNERIRENVPVDVAFLPYREAIALGAMALFDEKYGETVRVVRMGDFSTELCGGTHVLRTGDVGFFKILSDRSISADTRRVEALTGRAAVEYVQAKEQAMAELAVLLKAAPEEIMDKARRLLERQKELEREIRELRAKVASGQSRDLLEEAREIGGVRVLAAEVDLEDPKAMGDLSDRLKDRLGSGIVLLGSRSKEKVILTVSVSKDLQGRFPAGELMKEISRAVGGKGGGRPHFAQGGGPEVDRLPQALQMLQRLVEGATD